jgi:hypothetical protein
VQAFAQDSEPSKRVQLAEMSAFLFLIAPSLVFSFLLIKQGNLSFVLTAVSTILRDLALVCLILYFAWRNGEPLVRLGWTRQNWLQETVFGLLLFAPLFYGAAIVEHGLTHLGFSSPKVPLPSLVPGKTLAHLSLAFILVAVVALGESAGGRAAVGSDLLYRSWLRGIRRCGYRRSNGLGLRSRVRVATKPGRTHRNALPPRLGCHPSHTSASGPVISLSLMRLRCDACTARAH